MPAGSRVSRADGSPVREDLPDLPNSGRAARDLPRARRCARVTRVSIHDLLAALSAPDRLRDLTKALAMLDVIMSPDEDLEDRYFRFEPDGVDGLELASMENGSGDLYCIAFADDAVFGWGFAHESAMTPFALDPVQVWPGVLDGLPAQFGHLLQHPRFMLEGTFLASTAFWSQGGGPWHAGPSVPPSDDEDADGAGFVFELVLDDRPEAYAAFAEEYYETPIDLDAIRAIYAMQPLPLVLAARLNPDADHATLRRQAEAITYPVE